MKKGGLGKELELGMGHVTFVEHVPSYVEGVRFNPWHLMLGKETFCL